MKKCVAILVLLAMVMMGTAAYAGTTVYVEDEDAMRAAFNYVLDGVEYTFPTPVSELLDNGWEVISSVTELDAMTYVKRRFEDNALQKDGALIEASFLNATDAAKPIEDCTVGELAITPNRVTVPEEKRTAATKLFSLANGTKVGDTFQEVLDNYGLTLHTVEQGTEESFDDYFDQNGGLHKVSATDKPRYVLLKDGKYYDTLFSLDDTLYAELTFYFKIKQDGYKLSQPSLSSQEVGDNWLRIEFDRPLKEAEASVEEIRMQLWM